MYSKTLPSPAYYAYSEALFLRNVQQKLAQNAHEKQ